MNKNAPQSYIQKALDDNKLGKPRTPYYLAEDFKPETANADDIIRYIHINILKLHKRIEDIEKHLGMGKTH